MLDTNPITQDTVKEVLSINAEQITDASYWEGLFSKLLDFLPTVLYAFIFLFVGFKLIKFIMNFLKRILRLRQCDESVIGFVSTTVSVILKVAVIISFVGMLGIETTAFIAALGAAGLAVGLALQGTLQNFAGGVIILVLKPFRLNDLVEFGGHKGTVKNISIFNTTIDNPLTNELVVIPNSTVATSTIVNWSENSPRRVEAPFSISYGENIDNARKVVIAKAKSDARVLDSIDCEVIVKSLNSSSVDLELRVWVMPEHYFVVSSDMLELAYNTLIENNISMPFPQLDVKIKP